jgi:hypothetical protein
METTRAAMPSAASLVLASMASETSVPLASNVTLAALSSAST